MLEAHLCWPTIWTPGASTLPIEVVITKQKPDLVIVDKNNSNVTLVEWSIPFETTVDSTHDIQQLVFDIEEKASLWITIP